MTKTDIMAIVYNNKMLKEAIINVVDWKYREDFLSHFILQIGNTKEDKLISLYEKGQLDWFCLRIITNQWKSKNSTFWKIYRNGGFAGDNPILYVDEYEYTDEYEDETDIEERKDPEILEARVRTLLLTQYDDFYLNQYHKTLFDLYYFEKLNLREISEITDIKISSISRSLRKTKAWLKNKMI
jgi:RNA polymerase sigma factor (sigma-70 family)